ncbi:hypothetical protein V8E36_004818 [Tilletia maclaganii]
MLGTPERRLLVVRIARLCTILSCILFFAGVVSQLRIDVQASADDDHDTNQGDDYGGDDADWAADEQSDPTSKRYLATLIVSRSFLLFTILIVVLGHIALSDRVRSYLSKFAVPLQGSSWAQSDMAISDQRQRSQTLDEDLQGDVSRLIGSAIFMLFASAQELSRSISQYLLVTAFLLASVGVLNLMVAIMLYNLALKTLITPSSGNSKLDSFDTSVLRERPCIPSSFQKLASSSFTSKTRVGPNLATQARAHLPFSPRTPPPATGAKHAHIHASPVGPALAALNASPLSPPLAQSSNGRHPLATDENLRIELPQALPAFTPATIRPQASAAAPFGFTPAAGESDKDVLIRMWTAQMAEQKRAQLPVEDATRESGTSSHQQQPPAGPAHDLAYPGASTLTVPQTGGRMQITAPYLSLREARARYALRRAAAAANPSPAMAAGAKEGEAPQRRSSQLASIGMRDKALVSRSSIISESDIADADEEAEASIVGKARVQNQGDVAQHRLGSEIHSAPKVVSMQGVVERHQSRLSAVDVTLGTEASRTAGRSEELLPIYTAHARTSASGTPSIVISVSSTEENRQRRRPPSLHFQSCTRTNSLASQESPAYPHSDTTRWSRTSAGQTIRSGVPGFDPAVDGPKSVGSRTGGSRDEDRSLRERDSRYLSAVLAAIRGPAYSSSREPPSPVPSLPFPIPPLPPIPADPSPQDQPFPPVSPLRSPGMLSQLRSAQESALAKAKERNKLRSLWLTKTAHAQPNSL